MDEARRKAMAEALTGDEPLYGFYPHLNPRVPGKADTFNTPEAKAALVEGMLSMAPGSGEAMSARDAWNASGRAGQALFEGRFGEAASGYGDVALGTLGAIPGAGIIARGTKRGAAWMDKNVPAWMNKLLDAMMPADPKNTTFTFAGPTAKTADHEALAMAQDMKAKGASREEIWQATGWDLEKADKIPRFEIDDSASADISPMGIGLPSFSSKAENMLHHPKYYQAYPESAGLRVQYLKDPSVGGRYYDGQGFVASGDRNARRSISLHELQHDAQSREGFARGGNWKAMTDDPATVAHADELYRDMKSRGVDLADDDIRANAMTMAARARYHALAGEVEARNVQSRMNMTSDERRATPPWLTQDVPDERQIVRQR